MCVLDHDAIDTKVMPSITLVGSLLTFYKIPVSKELVQAVALGHFPITPTVVHAHLLAVPCLVLPRLINRCFQNSIIARSIKPIKAPKCLSG